MKGPKPNTEEDLSILKLRVKDKLSFRTIAELKKRNVKNVYIAYLRAKKLVGELSTV